MVGLLSGAGAAVIPIATTLKHSPQQIAFDEVGRQAIMADPAWNNGDYYATGQPERGLAVARMVGHITYMSDQSMEEKFSRRCGEQLQLQLHRRLSRSKATCATGATVSSSASTRTRISISPRRWIISTVRAAPLRTARGPWPRAFS